MFKEQEVRAVSFVVQFAPSGIQGSVAEDTTLLEIAEQLGVDFGSHCDSKGKCGKCRVRILSGATSGATAQERMKLTEAELSEGYRLACQVYARSDLRIDVPSGALRRTQRLQSERQGDALCAIASDVQQTAGINPAESIHGHDHDGGVHHGHHHRHEGESHHRHGHRH
jgi:ferredoxin